MVALAPLHAALAVFNYLSTWFEEPLSATPVIVTEHYVPTPDFGAPVASQLLFQEVIENSWGHDFVSNYEPPSGIEFDHVKFYLQFDSYGRQFDRLAHIYLDGVEIWRPSTPEPGNLSAITSNFTKDVSFALPLLKASGTLTFQLNNIMNDVYTGPFNTTLIAHYYRTGDSSVQIQESSWYAESPPSRIEALSPLLLSLPSDEDADLKVDQLSSDTVRAVLQVHASGNADEEFWYFKRSADGGPTRLAEIYVDGRLAGYADPFPQIYTGGYEPRIWTPLMGLRTFDVPAYYIDVTPFLPKLWDSETSIKIRIANGYNGKRVGNDWLVNLALLAWEEEGADGYGETHQTYRKDDPQIIDLPATQIVQVTHALRNSANLTLHGVPYYVESSQTLEHSNVKQDQNVLAFNIDGSTVSQVVNVDDNFVKVYRRDYEYALAITLDRKEITLAQTYEASIELANDQEYRVAAAHNGTWGGAKNEAGVCVGSFLDGRVQFGHSIRAEEREIVNETDQTCHDHEKAVESKTKSSRGGLYEFKDDNFVQRGPQ